MRRRVVRSVATLLLVLVLALAAQLGTSLQRNGWQWSRSIDGQAETVAYDTTLTGQPGGRVMCPAGWQWSALGWQWQGLSADGSQVASPTSTVTPFQSACGADQPSTTGWEWKKA